MEELENGVTLLTDEKNDTPICENHTVYTGEAHERFNSLIMGETTKLLVLIGSILCVALGIVFLIIDWESSKFFGFMLIVVGLLCSVLRFFILPMSVKKSYEKHTATHGSISFDYKFYDTYFEVETYSEKARASARIDYKNISRYIETGKDIALILDAKTGYYILKTGGEEAVRAALSGNYPNVKMKVKTK